jgi:Zn-dependent protease
MSVSSLNFTDTAQVSLAAAHQEAQARRSAHVEPEHVLMALLAPRSGSAWNLLVGTLGDPARLRGRVDAALAEIPPAPEPSSPTYSFRTERALREAGDEAQRTESPVDTLHLLLGLLDEGGAAANILRQAGLDARRLRHWLRLKQRGSPEPQVTPPRPRPLPALARPKPLPDEMPLRQALPRMVNWFAVLAQIGIVAAGVWLAARPDTETPGVVFVVFGGWIISLSAHEFAHALAADLGGDRSVRANGYLSLNPLAYTHVLLSIVMPIFFLLLGGIGLPGGAVYVDRSRLRGSVWHSAVSAAGPLASLLMAALFALPFLLQWVTGEMIRAQPALWGALSAVVLLNVWGVLFNLLPIPPLDGFGILAPWLPPDLRDRLYAFGFVGLWLVILAFWMIEPFGAAFREAMVSILAALRVSPFLAEAGLARFMFWR